MLLYQLGSKIKRICQDLKVTPKEGLGKPERLKYFKENVWYTLC